MEGGVRRVIPKIKIPTIKGSKFISHYAKYLISSGVPALDHNLDGGLPIGSLILVEEDVTGTVAKTLLKYFLAEGVICNNDIFIASQDMDPKLFYDYHLPDQVKTEEDYVLENIPDQKMKIAWRYQKKRQHNKVKQFEKSFGHYFDLSAKMNEDRLKESNSIFWNNDIDKLSGLNGNTSIDAYDDLLAQIRSSLETGGFLIEEGTKLADENNLLRIGIHSIGSPLWGLEDDEISIKKFIKFFYMLRTLIRSSLAVVFITVPSHLFQDPDIIQRIQHFCDICVRTESFVGSSKETNPLFKDYHGLFHMIKQAPINTLHTYLPDSFDLAYRTLRKRFIIEKLHLPPELEITKQREQDDISPYSSTSCASGGSKIHLDF